MKDRIKGLLTKKKLFRFFKITLIVVLTTIALLSLLGTVAHASGLVDDTVNADNLYSQYPLENYQLDLDVYKRQPLYQRGMIFYRLSALLHWQGKPYQMNERRIEK